MTNVITIEKGIPLPEDTYPFGYLQIGESFLIPGDSADDGYTLAVLAGQKLSKTFEVHPAGKALRVWRTM